MCVCAKAVCGSDPAAAWAADPAHTRNVAGRHGALCQQHGVVSVRVQVESFVVHCSLCRLRLAAQLTARRDIVSQDSTRMLYLNAANQEARRDRNAGALDVINVEGQSRVAIMSTHARRVSVSTRTMRVTTAIRTSPTIAGRPTITTSTPSLPVAAWIRVRRSLHATPPALGRSRLLVRG
jgi:hypothetical protein